MADVVARCDCDICGKDITGLTQVGRKQHVGRCVRIYMQSAMSGSSDVDGDEEQGPQNQGYIPEDDLSSQDAGNGPYDGPTNSGEDDLPPNPNARRLHCHTPFAQQSDDELAKVSLLK